MNVATIVLRYRSRCRPIQARRKALILARSNRFWPPRCQAPVSVSPWTSELSFRGMARASFRYGGMLARFPTLRRARSLRYLWATLTQSPPAHSLWTELFWRPRRSMGRLEYGQLRQAVRL